MTHDSTTSSLKYTTIVVSIATSGLNRRKHIPVEVSWYNLRTHDRDTFIPQHDVAWVLDNGDADSLELNSYRLRIEKQQQDDGTKVAELRKQLINSTVAGSNPYFSAMFLEKLMTPPWHYRLLDLGAYAMGKLNLDYVPGLADVCKLLGVHEPDHTAEGNAHAAAVCFMVLRMR